MKSNMIHKKYNLCAKAFILCLTITLGACSTDTIDTWSDSTALAWFGDNEAFNYTFVTEPAQTTQTSQEIDIKLATPVKDFDRTINVEEVKPLKNSQSKVEFEHAVKVEAGNSVAHLKVTFFRTPNLKSETDTLVVRIVPSADFMPGIVGFTEKTIVVTDTFIRPQWWDSTVVSNLGDCNQLKLSVYYAVFGTFDYMFGESMGSSEGQLATFRLNEYSKAHYGKQYYFLSDGDEPIQ